MSRPLVCPLELAAVVGAVIELADMAGIPVPTIRAAELPLHAGALRGAPRGCMDRPRGCFAHRAVLEDFPDLAGLQVYACGAPVMIDAARRDFATAGLPQDQFFADAFTSQADLAET